MTGIFPVDRSKLIHIDNPVCSRLQSVDPAYIPMLSPMPRSKKATTSNPIALCDSGYELCSEKQHTKDESCARVESISDNESGENNWEDMYSPYELTHDEISKKSTLPTSSLCSTSTIAKKSAKPWLAPENAVVLYSKQSMPIEKMLKYPSPIKAHNNPATKGTPSKNYSSRVLTSSENLAILEEKQRKKAEELKKKDERSLKKKQKSEGLCSHMRT